MALDPNIGRIKFLRTKTIGRKPTTNDIQEGELALNLTDRTIFSRSGDNIVDLGFGRGGKIEGSITATGDITSNNANFTHVYSTNYYSPNNFKFYTTTNGAQNIVAGGLGVMGEYANEGKIPGNGIYSQGQIKSDSTVTAPSFVGELTGNSATTTKLKNAVRINSVLFDGTTNITTPGYINLISSDNRTIRPSQLAPDSLGVYFTSLAGMNGVADNNFADLLAINTYRDNTAGLMSGLAFPKSGMQNPIHYRTDYGSATWGVGRRLAYLDDDSTGNSATASRLNKTTRITTTQAVTWYRLGKVTIPQNGRTLAIRMYGGVGYNGLSNQSAATTVIFKTGNANPVNADVAMDVLDGTSIPGQVGLLKLDDSNYEIFVQFGGYSTFNCVVEEEEGTTWTWQYASYATLPAGFQAGTVRVLAQTTSNVSSATRLQTPRTINGVSFNGTSDITIADNTKLPLSGGTLTGGLKAITLNAAGVGGYSPSGQGAYLSWNRSDGQGKTDFINNRGWGPGGFDWWNGTESGYTQVMSLDQNGVLNAIGGFSGNAATATKLLATDLRTLKPLDTGTKGISAYFVTEWGLNNNYTGGNYGDFLSLNTWHDASAGMQNGLFFDKTGKRIVHYQSAFGGANWGGGKTLAYAEDVLSINGGTMNAPINFNLSHAEGAFHKLIEGSTTADGGYIAVGNHGSDRGYVEIGTIDDPDAAIYARKRNSANTVLDEAIILGPDGNTSFPRSVNARTLGVNNTEGAGAGLSLYGGAVNGLPNYGISFAQTSNFGAHGYVNSDWATYFTMIGGASRGWIFRSADYGNVASISAQGNAQFNGNIVAGANITAFSDARLKDNITKIPDALNKLNQLKGVTYTRKDLATNQQYAGLIAQDVQKALPEAVAITEGDTLAVDYNGVIGLLVEAIKELNNRIDKLERI